MARLSKLLLVVVSMCITWKLLPRPGEAPASAASSSDGHATAKLAAGRPTVVVRQTPAPVPVTESPTHAATPKPSTATPTKPVTTVAQAAAAAQVAAAASAGAKLQGSVSYHGYC